MEVGCQRSRNDVDLLQIYRNGFAEERRPAPKNQRRQVDPQLVGESLSHTLPANSAPAHNRHILVAGSITSQPNGLSQPVDELNSPRNARLLKA